MAAFLIPILVVARVGSSIPAIVAAARNVGTAVATSRAVSSAMKGGNGWKPGENSKINTSNAVSKAAQAYANKNPGLVKYMADRNIVVPKPHQTLADRLVNKNTQAQSNMETFKSSIDRANAVQKLNTAAWVERNKNNLAAAHIQDLKNLAGDSIKNAASTIARDPLAQSVAAAAAIKSLANNLTDQDSDDTTTIITGGGEDTPGTRDKRPYRKRKRPWNDPLDKDDDLLKDEEDEEDEETSSSSSSSSYEEDEENDEEDDEESSSSSSSSQEEDEQEEDLNETDDGGNSCAEDCEGDAQDSPQSGGATLTPR